MIPPESRTAPPSGAHAARTAEDTLVAAERWALWRTLARGIAHGLANAAQMLALDPIPPAAREEAIERIHVAIARLADVHRAVPAGPVVVAEALAELQAVQRLQAGFPSTELRLDVAAALPAVAMPADDLAHVLLAIVTDAKRAAAGGRATIDVRARAREAGVEIEIGGDGPAHDAGRRERAFEPPAAGDTGLHVARLLCRRAGGDLVTFDGRAGLRLTLPAWRRPAAGGDAV